MSVSEAAKKIGISSSKLYQLVAGRRIAHYRVGGKIIFGDDDVAEFLASCHIGIAAQPSLNPPQRDLKHVNLR